MRLIDADALIDDIKNHLWDWENVNGITAQTVLKQTITDIKNQPTVNPWHRVKDGLPESGKIVLVYDDWDRLSICQLDNQYRWFRQGGGWFDVPYVRYWMPIPEPPKEDA